MRDTAVEHVGQRMTPLFPGQQLVVDALNRIGGQSANVIGETFKRSI